MNDSSQRHQRRLWQAILSSAIWRYTAYGIGLGCLLLLARLFTPEQFGIVAAVNIFAVLGMVIAESGLGPAIINQKNFESEKRDGVFTFTLLMGVFLAIAIWLMAPIWVWFYDDDQVGRVVPSLAIAIFFSALSIVPLAHLQRDKHFARIGLADGLGELLGTGVSVLCLMFDEIHGVVALALRLPARNAVRFIVLWNRSRITEFGRPWFGRDIRGVMLLLRFALYQLGFNMINILSRNVDQLVVGKAFGLWHLGVYDRSYQLMRYPLQLLTFAVSPAIQPVMRDLSSNKEISLKLHSDLVWKLGWLGALVGLFVIFASDIIVVILLGDDWRAVVPLIETLGLAIPCQVQLSVSGGFFQALGRPGLLFLSGCLSAATIGLALLLGVLENDLNKLCLLLIGAFHINYVQAHIILYKLGLNAGCFSWLPWSLPIMTFLIICMVSVSLTQLE